MRKRRGLAVLLSAVLLVNSGVYVYASGSGAGSQDLDLNYTLDDTGEDIYIGGTHTTVRIYGLAAVSCLNSSVNVTEQKGCTATVSGERIVVGEAGGSLYSAALGYVHVQTEEKQKNLTVVFKSIVKNNRGSLIAFQRTLIEEDTE